MLATSIEPHPRCEARARHDRARSHLCVSVVSTGSVWIRPEHIGPTKKNVYLWLLTSHQWTNPLPINAYVVEHREGLVLFDAGQDRAAVTDSTYFPPGFTGFLYDRLNRFPTRR